MTTWMTRYIDAWNRPDGEAASAFHSEDAVCEDVGTGSIRKGRGELAAWCQWAHQGSPDVRFHTVSEQQCGDWYAIEYEAVGTNTGEVDGQPPTNKPFRVRGISVGQLDGDGKIKVNREYNHIMENG
jgi:steroid delta-isomerase-like uncharacterized protein